MIPAKINIEAKPYLLKNKIQHYEWGTTGRDAIIPGLLGIVPEDGMPYAELWIGAHPKASSSLEIDGKEIPLDKLIDSCGEEILGTEAFRAFNRKLPFLLKVLSASHALSIQAHPDKNKAQILHSRDPKNYPDDNHKPEIAIALDSLEALVGFKPLEDFLAAVKEYKGIEDFLGSDAFSYGSSDNEGDIIKNIYQILIKRSVAEPELLKAAVKKIKEDLLKKEKKSMKKEENLFLELEGEYGADVGLFSVFLFNFVKLKEGEGIFLNAGIPHAYLKGNIIECMANSDNVVRAGLTPKFKDVDSLMEILSYDLTPAKVLNTESLKGEVTYKTPVNEFEITKWEYAEGTEKIVNNEGFCIFLIIRGNISFTSAYGTAKFNKGDAVLLPAILKEYKLAFSDDSLVFKAGIPHSQYFRFP